MKSIPKRLLYGTTERVTLCPRTGLHFDHQFGECAGLLHDQRKFHNFGEFAYQSLDGGGKNIIPLYHHHLIDPA